MKSLFLTALTAVTTLATLPALADGTEVPPAEKQHVRHMKARHSEHFYVQYEFNFSSHTLEERKLKDSQIKFHEIFEEDLPGTKNLAEAIEEAKKRHAIGAPFNKPVKVNICSETERLNKKPGCEESMSGAMVAGYKIFEGKPKGKGKKEDIKPLCTYGDTEYKGLKKCEELLDDHPGEHPQDARAAGSGTTAERVR